MFFVNITDRICLEIICGVAGEQKEEVENIPTLLAAATGEDTVYIYYTGRNKAEKKKTILAEIGFQDRWDFWTDKF